ASAPVGVSSVTLVRTAAPFGRISTSPKAGSARATNACRWVLYRVKVNSTSADPRRYVTCHFPHVPGQIGCRIAARLPPSGRRARLCLPWGTLSPWPATVRILLVRRPAPPERHRLSRLPSPTLHSQQPPRGAVSDSCPRDG